MDCGKCKTMLVDLLYGELSHDQEAQAFHHLRQCEDCAREYEQLQETLVAVRSVEDPEPPPFINTRIMAEAKEQAHKSLNPRSLWTRIVRPAVLTAAAIFIAVSVLYIMPEGQAPDLAMMKSESPPEQKDMLAMADKRRDSAKGLSRQAPSGGSAPAKAMAPEPQPALDEDGDYPSAWDDSGLAPIEVQEADTSLGMDMARSHQAPDLLAPGGSTDRQDGESVEPLPEADPTMDLSFPGGRDAWAYEAYKNSGMSGDSAQAEGEGVASSDDATASDPGMLAMLDQPKEEAEPVDDETGAGATGEDRASDDDGFAKDRKPFPSSPTAESEPAAKKASRGAAPAKKPQPSPVPGSGESQKAADYLAQARKAEVQGEDREAYKLYRKAIAAMGVTNKEIKSGGKRDKSLGWPLPAPSAESDKSGKNEKDSLCSPLLQQAIEGASRTAKRILKVKTAYDLERWHEQRCGK